MREREREKCIHNFGFVKREKLLPGYRRRWEDTSEMQLKETGFEGMDCNRIETSDMTCWFGSR
jgi:hypothetical protein